MQCIGTFRPSKHYMLVVKLPNSKFQIVYNGSQAINAYKFTFLPHLERPETLGFIGLVQAIGAVMPIAELQARWYTRLISGKHITLLQYNM